MASDETKSALAKHNQPVISSSRIEKRYSTAYNIANSNEGTGSIYKALAFLVGVLVVVGAVMLSFNFDLWISFFAAVVGIAIAINIYITGIQIMAQGQLVKATLDTAINTSPFLNDEQKATVMGLKQKVDDTRISVSFTGNATEEHVTSVDEGDHLILKLIVEGKQPNEIAQELSLPPVDFAHRMQAIHRKFNTEDLQDLLRKLKDVKL